MPAKGEKKQATDAFLRWLSKKMETNRDNFHTINKATGIDVSTMSRWYNEKMMPAYKSVDRLARHYSVEPRVIYELLGRIAPVSLNQLDEEEMAWQKLYRRLNIDERRKLIDMAGVLFGTAFDNEPGEEPQK